MQVSKIGAQGPMSNSQAINNRQKSNNQTSFGMAFSKSMQAHLTNKVVDILEIGAKKGDDIFEKINYIKKHPLIVDQSENLILTIHNPEGTKVHALPKGDINNIEKEIDKIVEGLKNYDELKAVVNEEGAVREGIKTIRQKKNDFDAKITTLLLDNKIKGADATNLIEERSGIVVNQEYLEGKLDDVEQAKEKLANFFQKGSVKCS